jgi:hypothetical protein
LAFALAFLRLDFLVGVRFLDAAAFARLAPLDERSQPYGAHATTCPCLALWPLIFWLHLDSLCRIWLAGGGIACLGDIAADPGKLLFQIFAPLSKMLVNLATKLYQIANANSCKFECCLTCHGTLSLPVHSLQVYTYPLVVVMRPSPPAYHTLLDAQWQFSPRTKRRTAMTGEHVNKNHSLGRPKPRSPDCAGKLHLKRDHLLIFLKQPEQSQSEDIVAHIAGWKGQRSLWPIHNDRDFSKIRTEDGSDRSGPVRWLDNVRIPYICRSNWRGGHASVYS